MYLFQIIIEIFMNRYRKIIRSYLSKAIGFGAYAEPRGAAAIPILPPPNFATALHRLQMAGQASACYRAFRPRIGKRMIFG